VGAASIASESRVCIPGLGAPLPKTGSSAAFVRRSPAGLARREQAQYSPHRDPRRGTCAKDRLGGFGCSSTRRR
jgi:hypothetical protein